MTLENCPPFLQPRLRLFLSADIVGSTSLKQSRAAPDVFKTDAQKGPRWFSAIQGFYFEAFQAFIYEWSQNKEKSSHSDEFYGEEPLFWKSIGDEVLFTKVISDHRQLTLTLLCWFSAINRVRTFLKIEDSSLDVKSTAWLAGFPFKNREVVIGQYNKADDHKIEDYYQESGKILNDFYINKNTKSISIDYIGPSIDTGFRLCNFSSSRKMVVSIDVAYILSMTSFDGEVSRIDLNYDGSHSLKGVMGGAPYPVFWINMSKESSLAVKEDKLKSQNTCNKEDVKEFCDAFYSEYSMYIFKPFIKNEITQTLTTEPPGYQDYHNNLVKNFLLSDIEYSNDGEPESESDQSVDQDLLNEIIEVINVDDGTPQTKNNFKIGDYATHKKFGRGRVQAIDGQKITVEFPDFGHKRIFEPFLDP